MRKISFFHTSIMVRLQLLFVLVVIPIITTGLVFQFVGQHALDDQMMYTFSAQLRFQINEIKEHMVASKEDAVRLATRVKTLKLTGMPWILEGFDRVSAIADMEVSMEDMLLQHPIIDHIELYIPKLNRRISTKSEMPNYAVIENENFATFLEISRSHGNATVYEDRKLLSIINEPLLTPSTINYNSRTLVYIEYSLDRIRQQLGAIIPEKNPRYALLTPGGDVITTNEDDAAFVESIQRWSARHAPSDTSALRSDGDLTYQGIDRIDGRDLFLIVRDSDAQGFRCVFYLDKDAAFSNVALYRRSMVVLIAVFILAIVLYGIFAYLNVHRPIQQLVGAFERLQRGEMDFTIPVRGRSEFSYLMERMNETLVRLKTNVDQLLHHTRLTQRAQLKQLQAQINPHFLYNCFYLLSGMLEMDDTLSARNLAKLLGSYIQYIVRNASDDVPLSDEIAHARAYADMQKMRFGKRLLLDFCEPPHGFPNPSVPRLIIQPILENAFVHSIEKKVSAGSIIVNYTADERYARIAVENDGVTYADELVTKLNDKLRLHRHDDEITGLLNVNDRLTITQGMGLMVESPGEGWLRVTISIRVNI